VGGGDLEGARHRRHPLGLGNLESSARRCSGAAAIRGGAPARPRTALARPWSSRAPVLAVLALDLGLTRLGGDLDLDRPGALVTGSVAIAAVALAVPARLGSAVGPATAAIAPRR
jgi:hypothetical protein